MRHLLLAGAAALALVVGPMTAQAVDVVNEDENMHEILVDIDGNANATEILPGDTLTDICKRCTISLGDNEVVDADGDQVAVIKGGKLQLKSE